MNKNGRKMTSSKHIDLTSSDSNQKLLPVPINVKRTKTEKPKETTTVVKRDEKKFSNKKCVSSKRALKKWTLSQ